MYLRKVQVRSSNGATREYLRLQETFRERQPGGGTRHRQRVLGNLGRVDLLAPHAARLYELLTDQPPAGAPEPREDSVQAWGWGPLLVARQLWETLHLDRSLRQLGRCARDPQGRELAERAFALVANRLLDPVSEHKLAQWLETDFVCDEAGQRWLPRWRDDAERRASKSPRVRVEWAWLHGWYRALDRLLACQSALEVALFETLRTLFEVDVELALYDITSTYFEGAGPDGLARHGHARDQRPRQPQVVLGLVLIDGWPIAQHVFAGNRKDATRVQAVVTDLQERFGLKRIVFVGERGMLSEENRKALERAGCGYLLGVPRRNNVEAQALLEEAGKTPLEQWTLVEPRERGPAARKRGLTRVLEVPSARAGVRCFAVHSEERLEYERAQREQEQKRLEEKLEGLRQRVRAGRLKQEAAIAAAAERILQKHPGRRHVTVQAGPGQFEYQASARAACEQGGEGHYLLETTEARLTAVEAVEEYKQLVQVEQCFAQLKDVIEMRPVWHQTPERVQAHLFVAGLALLLHRLLERQLQAAREDLSANAAWKALATIKLVEFETEEGTKKRIVTRGSEQAGKVLKALRLKRSAPPTPSNPPAAGAAAVW